MRLNKEVTHEEFDAKKKELTKEKEKHEELLTDTNYRAETWIDREENMFSSAASAKGRSEQGTPAEKRCVLSCPGMNIVLKDKKLQIAWHKGLALFEDIPATVEGIHNAPPQRRELEVAYS